MSKAEKSKSGCMGCLGLIVIFFIALVISTPIASYVATENLEGGVKLPFRFEVIAIINEEEGARTISRYHESIEQLKTTYPDLTIDVKPGKGTIESDEEFKYTNFTVIQQGDKKKVTVKSYDDDYTYTSVYDVKDGKIYPISHLNFGPGMMGLIIPYAFGMTAVFYVLIQIMKALVKRKSPGQQRSLEL